MPKIIFISISTLMFVLSGFLSTGYTNGNNHGHGKSHGKKVGDMKKMKLKKKMDHGAHTMGKGDIVPCMHMPEKMGDKKTMKTRGKVVILKPADGAVIHSRNLKVEFDIPDRGSRGNHLHIYLDGRCLNMIRSGKSYHISGLKEGAHKIDLRLVDKDHLEYGPQAVTNIKVVKKKAHNP
mgnify:FL=1